MKESVAITKEADAKKDFSPTKSGDSSIQRLRDEHEMQLGSLRGVIGNIRRDGSTPSVDSIATELSSIPSAQRASALLALQKTHGNRYVQQVVTGIQAKLRIGQPRDIYEQEADGVADEVMRMSEPEVQRQPEAEEELIQTKLPTEQIAPLVQRQEELKEEKEEPVMAKEISRRKLQISDDLETCLNLSKGGGYPLPENTRLFMENRFGVDPDDYMRNSEQGARDTNMRSGTSRFLATLFRRCASRPTPGAGTAAPSAPSPAATTGATPCRPTFVSLNAVKTGNIVMTTSWGRCELALGTHGSPGMTFRSRVNVPGGCTGTLYYLQLVDGCAQMTNASSVNEHIKTNGYVLDTSDPYTSRRVTSHGTVDFETTDSPSGGHANSNTYLYDVDRFKMWLLWRPDSPAGSSRVPLAVVRWNWTARANKTGTRGCASAWTISNDNANGGTGSATSTSPTWSRTYPDNFSYVSGVC